MFGLGTLILRLRAPNSLLLGKLETMCERFGREVAPRSTGLRTSSRRWPSSSASSCSEPNPGEPSLRRATRLAPTVPRTYGSVSAPLRLSEPDREPTTPRA